MSRPHKVVAALMILIISISAAFYVLLDAERRPGQVAQLAAGILFVPQGRDLPSITLTDQQGASFKNAALTGHWSLVLFGYTFCPDVCPTLLADLRQLVALLPQERRQQIRVVMVSVDPHRDTPEQLRRYLGFFNPDFIGVTGELTDIQGLSHALGIPFIPGDCTRADYRVDHGTNLAIIGPDGRFHGFVRTPLNIRRLAEQLPHLLDEVTPSEKALPPKG